jgi:hypothetical protein
MKRMSLEMIKNFWQRDRQSLFRNLLKQYKEEGYDIKEARYLAKIELNEMMEDKEEFVDNLWKETFEDV